MRRGTSSSVTGEGDGVGLKGVSFVRAMCQFEEAIKLIHYNCTALFLVKVSLSKSRRDPEYSSKKAIGQ